METTTMHEITLRQDNSEAIVIPERGAIVAEWRVAGRPVLYLNRDSLTDPARSVRGGIPLLFPFAGRLANEVYRHKGTRMPQHGFARQQAWAVERQRPNMVLMSLSPDAATSAVYPYPFRLEHRVEVTPAALHIELLVANEGDEPMPVAPGWHPYFICPRAQKSDVRCRGGLAGFTGFGDDREYNYGLTAPTDGKSSYDIPGIGRVAIEHSPQMRHLQFWTLPGADYVCIEPWVGGVDAINAPNPTSIPAAGAFVFFMRLELVAPAV
jgi:galactose mutarotase-like enzyme